MMENTEESLLEYENYLKDKSFSDLLSIQNEIDQAQYPKKYQLVKNALKNKRFDKDVPQLELSAEIKDQIIHQFQKTKNSIFQFLFAEVIFVSEGTRNEADARLQALDFQYSRPWFTYFFSHENVTKVKPEANGYVIYAAHILIHKLPYIPAYHCSIEPFKNYQVLMGQFKAKFSHVLLFTLFMSIPFALLAIHDPQIWSYWHYGFIPSYYFLTFAFNWLALRYWIIRKIKKQFYRIA